MEFDTSTTVNELLPPEIWHQIQRYNVDVATALSCGAAGITYYRPLFLTAYVASRVCAITKSQIIERIWLLEKHASPRCVRALNRLFEVAHQIGITLGIGFLRLNTFLAMHSQLSFPTSTFLDLYGSEIGNTGATQIIEALPNFSVEILRLGDNHIGDEGAVKIAEALPKSSLTMLGLMHNEITLFGAIAIATALSSSRVSTLDMSANQFGSQGVAVISSVLPETQITHLDLSYNPLGIEGAFAIAISLRLSSLTTLVLKCASFGLREATLIADALRHSSLITLDISENNLNVEVLHVLGEGLANSCVTDLNLENCDSIGNEEARVIAAALPFCILEKLDLSGNLIGVEGIRALVDALPSCSVSELIVSFNEPITDGEKFEIIDMVQNLTGKVKLSI